LDSQGIFLVALLWLIFTKICHTGLLSRHHNRRLLIARRNNLLREHFIVHLRGPTILDGRWRAIVFLDLTTSTEGQKFRCDAVPFLCFSYQDFMTRTDRNVPIFRDFSNSLETSTGRAHDFIVTFVTWAPSVDADRHQTWTPDRL